MKDSRFSEEKCCIIGYDAFEEVMQELLDDKSIKVEREYPCLSCYSTERRCGYEEGEIVERLESHFDRRIMEVFKDETKIFFIFETTMDHLAEHEDTGLAPEEINETRTGKWVGIIVKKDDRLCRKFDIWYPIACTECGEPNYKETNFCPHCGAKMEIEDE